jgi:predicted transcriptional regulator
MIPEVSEVQRRRKLLGLTQTQIAKMSGVSQSLIAKIESGKIDPSYSRVKKLLETMDRLKKKDEKLAKEVMVTKMFKVTEKDKVKKAVDMMHKYAISQIPVFRNGTMVGGISERTLINLASEGHELNEVLRKDIGSVMEIPFPTVSQETPVKALSSLLSVFPAVVVVKQNKIVGIIARSDLF